MKFITNLSRKLNQSQKIILGIVVGLILLILTLTIADSLGGRGGSFDWEDTWLVWLLFVAIVGYFEFKLFS